MNNTPAHQKGRRKLVVRQKHSDFKLIAAKYARGQRGITIGMVSDAKADYLNVRKQFEKDYPNDTL